LTDRFQYGNNAGMEHPLRAYRLSQQPPLSRAELAGLLGVGRPTVFRWESGSRQIKESLIHSISEITGIPAKELRPDLIKKHEEIFGGAQ
jgi:transcriptional regulator with XRE-family HTH domain